jgi:hypothetical protein
MAVREHALAQLSTRSGEPKYLPGEMQERSDDINNRLWTTYQTAGEVAQALLDAVAQERINLAEDESDPTGSLTVTDINTYAALLPMVADEGARLSPGTIAKRLAHAPSIPLTAAWLTVARDRLVALEAGARQGTMTVGPGDASGPVAERLKEALAANRGAPLARGLGDGAGDLRDAVRTAERSLHHTAARWDECDADERDALDLSSEVVLTRELSRREIAFTERHPLGPRQAAEQAAGQAAD